MSVPYEEALNSLQSMFSTFDRELIGALLQQSNGHMEKTIDILLEMSGETPINQNTDADQSIAQMQQDEMLARMLQNELFVNEIRNDRDFALLFQQRERREEEQRRRNNTTYYDQQPTPLQQSGNGGGGGSGDGVHTQDESPLSLFEEDFGDIKEKLNQLGEAAKNKFKELSDFFMKKEETRYSSVNTNDEGEEEEDQRDNINKRQGRKVEFDQDDEEVVAFDRNPNVIRRNHLNINNSFSVNSSSDDDSNYDSFVLDNDRDKKSTNSSGGLKLRSMAGSRKED